MVVCDHWILDNTALPGTVSSCLQGIDTNAIVESSAEDQVIASNIHLARRLEQRLRRLDSHLKHNLFWAVCHNNIHSFAQLLALIG